MRHLKSGRKLNMNSPHRKAMFRNMVTSLMLHERIKTTEPRAKELRRIADRIISLGKRVPPSTLVNLTGEELKAAQARRVHAIRLARKWITDRDALDKVFNVFSERYALRPGGYTRLYKLGFRVGDNASMSFIELVQESMGDLDEAVVNAQPEEVPLAAGSAPEEVSAGAEE